MMPTLVEQHYEFKGGYPTRETIRHAYDELERMGAITLVRGRGSFVAQPPPAMGVRAQAVQIDSLAKQALATAAAAGIDPVALADRIKALVKKE